MIEFTKTSPSVRLGIFPRFFDINDPDGAVAQIDKCYVSGWNEFEGFELIVGSHAYSLSYPDDPPMKEMARAQLRDETIVLFEYDWVAVIQKDGTYNVARID